MKKKERKKGKERKKNPRYRPGEYKRVLEQKITGEEEGKKSHADEEGRAFQFIHEDKDTGRERESNRYI